MSKRFNPGYSDPKGILMFAFGGPAVGGILASGTTVPADATIGYANGCIFIDRDAAAGAQVWVNEGTVSSSLFKALIRPGVDLSGLVATAAELNRAAQNSTRPVSAAGATLTVTQALHDGKTIKLDQATGTAVTLPVMTGSGARYRFVCTVATSGGSQVITATAAHLFGNLFFNTDTGAGTLWTAVAAASPSGSTIITLDGSTKGGRKGDWFEIEDLASGVGVVRGSLNGSGTEATPFS